MVSIVNILSFRGIFPVFFFLLYMWNFSFSFSSFSYYFLVFFFSLQYALFLSITIYSCSLISSYFFSFLSCFYICSYSWTSKNVMKRISFHSSLFPSFLLFSYFPFLFFINRMWHAPIIIPLFLFLLLFLLFYLFFNFLVISSLFFILSSLYSSYSLYHKLKNNFNILLYLFFTSIFVFSEREEGGSEGREREKERGDKKRLDLRFSSTLELETHLTPFHFPCIRTVITYIHIRTCKGEKRSTQKGSTRRGDAGRRVESARLSTCLSTWARNL